MPAFTGSGAILPTQYYTLMVIFCQEKKAKNRGLWRQRNGGGKESKPAASANTSGAQRARFKPKDAASGLREQKWAPAHSQDIPLAYNVSRGMLGV
jgi:hypothetical protein